MALGIGELDGCTRSWNTKCHSIFFLNTNKRITRMFFGTRISQISRILCSWCLNTRFFLNTNFTHEFYLAHGSHFLSTRISLSRILISWCLNTNFTNKTNVFWHTDLTLTDLEPSARCEWQLVTVIGSLWLLTHCGYWLVVVIDSLWLLARCGCWLIVVIDLLWLLACCGYWLVVVIDLLCFKWQIKKDIREPCEALADPWDLWDPCAK